MAMLWAKQIMLGKKAFSQVPRLLKNDVKKILVENKRDDLIIEEETSTPSA